MKFPHDNSADVAAPVDRPGPATGRAPQAPAGAPAQVAESGNTATHSCKTGDRSGCPAFQVVWQGIDTLEISYRGQLSDEKHVELQSLKELAQSHEPAKQARAQIQVGERTFEVGDRGGGRMFAFLLRHPDMRISVSSSRAKRMPLALVTFQNEFLVNVGPTDAQEQALRVVATLGEVEGSEFVSRCDVAADICTFEDIGSWTRESWVTRVKKLRAHWEEDVFSGWSLGLGADISARLYDKRLEIQVESGKTYFEDLWTEAGWFPGDPVKRLEIQLRRAVLEQLGLRSVGNVQTALAGVWAYATREWTRLAVPNASDSTKTRWPLHPFWERVQEITWEGEQATLRRERPRYGAPRDKTFAVRFKALATALMARDGLKTLDEAAAKLVKLTEVELVQLSQWEGASTDVLLREAVALKRRKFCIGLNGP